MIPAELVRLRGIPTVRHLFDAIAVAAAALVALRSGVSPVGVALTDALWAVALAVIVGLSVTRAHTLLLIAIAALGVLTMHTLGLLAASGIGLAALCLLLGTTRSSPHLESAVKALTAPLVMMVLTDFEDFGRVGVSALVAAAVVCGLVGSAVYNLEGRPRQFLVFLLPAVLVVGLLASVMVAFQLSTIRTSLLAAQAGLGNIEQTLGDGNIEAAHNHSAAAAADLGDAVEVLSSPAVRAARFAPVAGPNIATLDAMLPSAHDVATDTTTMLAILDETEFYGTNGVSIPAVSAVGEQLDKILGSADGLRDSLDETDSHWLLPALSTGRDQLRDSLDGLPHGYEVAPLLEQLLGAEAPRDYLVLFANPAEARELGGFTGSTAVLNVDDGKIRLIASTRNGILNQNPTDSSVLTSSVPQRFLEHRPWQYAQNYTGTADLPTVGRTLADIIPAVTGTDIDGVMYVDPVALDALVALTGPIKVSSLDRTFGPGDLAQFLTRGQYATNFETRGEREQLFAELGEAAFAALSSGDFDTDSAAMEKIARVVEQGRLAFAPLDPDELALIDTLGASGAITPRDDLRDYLAVSHINGAPNKLDAYLHRSVEYDVRVDGEQLEATVTMTLDNRAPNGLADYAAGNNHDLPTGTNRLTLIVHTPHELVDWLGADDEPALTRSYREYDRWRHETVVIVPAGESRTVELELRGSAAPGDYLLDIDAQPLIHADEVSVVVNGEARESMTLRKDVRLGD